VPELEIKLSTWPGPSGELLKEEEGLRKKKVEVRRRFKEEEGLRKKKV
jgi:hypothetical protein